MMSVEVLKYISDPSPKQQNVDPWCFSPFSDNPDAMWNCLNRRFHLGHSSECDAGRKSNSHKERKHPKFLDDYSNLLHTI